MNINVIIEDYERRYKTAMKEIKKGGNDITLTRLGTKASCYRTIIVELKQLTTQSRPAVMEELCDGCNVRTPWEYRCHGTGCNCDNPVCMRQQGKITHEELMVIVNKGLGIQKDKP